MLEKYHRTKDVRQKIHIIEELKYDDELCNAQAQSNQYNLERRNQEIEKHRLEKKLENFEEIHKNKTNQLVRHQQNLNAVEESLCQIQTNIKSLEANQIQLLNEVEYFEKEQNKLDWRVTNLISQSNDLQKLKEEAIQKWKNTENEHVAVQHRWVRRKYFKREHQNQLNSAIEEERRLKIELEQCQHEKMLTEMDEQCTEAQQHYNEVETKSSKRLVMSNVSFPFLPFALSPALNSIGLEAVIAPGATNLSAFQQPNLQRKYRQKIEELDYKRLKLIDKLEEARVRISHFREEHSQIVEALIQDEKEVERKSLFCWESKATAEKYIKEHQDVCECEKEVEHKLRVINDKLQQTQEQIKTTTNDIHLYKQLRTIKTNEIDDLKQNIKHFKNELIEKHHQSMEQLRDVIQQKRVALSDTVQCIENYKSIVKKLEGMN
ncbi:unnamed protein product [Rotaria sp. Silwood1]|nr:unnamed protein product [Rotaria sp. Silwood1]CAF4691145.1 unnamed protein product [Rotaria sp. Silwood1]